MRGRTPRSFVLILLFAAFHLIAVHDPASAEVRIRNDPGGLIAGHMREFAYLRDSGQPVVIDGPCMSACTLVLGMIPPERLCATRRAVLGFHAAWAFAPDGSVVASREGTASLLQVYPPRIRNWISRRGGLSKRTIVLKGRELAAIVRSCR